MHDYGLQQQVDAALRHAIALTTDEQHHRDCALILELVRQALNIDCRSALDLLAQDVMVIGFSSERISLCQTADRQLMMSLEAIDDIVEAQPVTDLMAGVLGMARWVYVCLVDGDHGRLRALASCVERTVFVGDAVEMFTSGKTGRC